MNTPLTYAPVYWAASQIGQGLWPGLGPLEAIALGSALLGPAVGMLVFLVPYSAWGWLPAGWRQGPTRKELASLAAKPTAQPKELAEKGRLK